MSKARKKIVLDYEYAIKQLQSDLQYQADKGSLSTAFFDRQNRILKSLITYYKDSELEIEVLEDQILKEQKEQRRIRQYYDKLTHKFEAICFIHGIYDLLLWLEWPREILVRQANEYMDEKEMQMPIFLNEKIDALPKEESKTVLDFLLKKTNQNLAAALAKVNLKRKITLFSK